MIGITKSWTRPRTGTGAEPYYTAGNVHLEFRKQSARDEAFRNWAWANENHSNGRCLPERAGQRILNEEVIAKERGRGALGKVRGKPWNHRRADDMSSSKIRTEKSNH